MKIATLTALFVAAAVAAAAAVIPIPSIPNNDDTVIIRATTSNGAEQNSLALPNFACYSRWLFSTGNDIISGIPFTAGQSQPSADLASRSLAHSVGLLCNRLGPSSYPTRDAVQSLLVISFNTDNSSNLIVAPFNEIANLKIRGTDIIRLELIAGYGDHDYALLWAPVQEHGIGGLRSIVFKDIGECKIHG
ncbi:uncharacterized protein SEPMUDRAFT_117902 [Sphaerulina musiva SO2202]|uniref:Uncharacterized protein n=1 Tax=Sphaerulina musiva (strain SO2202) TaxID=692275 RepID=N1QHM0_SPHMS|nr:uncharacterized protein SEPMUDRAFT_117902 [Sphaerulina musiva SO2202]EMF11949.1 hypothetical protein SEPMUDRAFT_117902 [Sphaerulina musiva SO2202]